VFQHYELVDSQWSASPFIRQPAAPNETIGKRIAQKAGGVPTPVFLTNAVLETYQQRGYQPAAGQVATTKPGDAEAVVFATESCAGCHSQASIAVGYTLDVNGEIDRTKKPVLFPGQLAGDYSFMFGKASYRARD
jgi:hypothetical protein